MAGRELLIGSYFHVANFPRADEALRTLKTVASMVMPIIRSHGWKVKELGEIYPKDSGLLGFNQNKSKICLRLRYAGDKTQFLPMQQVLDTMLHELCHMVHSHHHSRFHALWNKLRDEYMDLILKGYTGEGFISQGTRLGGSELSDHERSRLAREAAEKRRLEAGGSSSGQRLGGSAAAPDQDIRSVIADAVDRRNKTLRGCGTERLSHNQIRAIADSATQNGFRTQAEEDEANEEAISRALWELAQQEEEYAEYGHLDIPAPKISEVQAGQSTTPGTVGGSSSTGEDLPAWQHMWECDICTLQNPATYLCCDACGTERPESKAPIKAPDGARSSESRRSPIDLTGSPPRKKSRSKSQRITEPATAKTWACVYCGKQMELQWWTCSGCGRMKDSS